MFGDMHAYGKTPSAFGRGFKASMKTAEVDIQTTDGLTLKLVPGTKSDIIVVADPSGRYPTGPVSFEANPMLWSTLAVTAVDALKKNKAVMTPTVVDPRAEQKFRPGGGAATTEMTTTEESGMHPVLKWTLIAGGTAVGVYGVYYVARRYGLI